MTLYCEKSWRNLASLSSLVHFLHLPTTLYTEEINEHRSGRENMKAIDSWARGNNDPETNPKISKTNYILSQNTSFTSLNDVLK